MNIGSTNLIPLTKGRKGYTIRAGESLPIKFSYQYGQVQGSNLFLKAFLDADFNPYSTNETLLQTFALDPSGISNVTSASIAMESGASVPGVYAVGAAISDGFHTRYLYAPELLRVLPSIQPPEITLATFNAGVFQARLVGAIGQTIVVEKTSNFVDWMPVATNTLPTTEWQFTDPSATNDNVGVYRAKLIE